MTKVYNAPEPFWNDIDMTTPFLFLGGSIDMGGAAKWQDVLISDLDSEDVIILNPRRDDWDSSWSQEPEEGNNFTNQVNWEMYGQDVADLNVYYFAAKSMAPITLLEMGKYASVEKTVVYCDPEYTRRGNVILFCNRYGIVWTEDYDEFLMIVKEKIATKNEALDT